MVFSMDHQFLNILISALYLLNELIMYFLVILDTLWKKWYNSSHWHYYLYDNWIHLDGIYSLLQHNYATFFSAGLHSLICDSGSLYHWEISTIDSNRYTSSYFRSCPQYYCHQSLSIQIIDITTVTNPIITNVICNIFNSCYY